MFKIVAPPKTDLIATGWKEALRCEVLQQSVLTLGLAFALFIPVCVGSHTISPLRFLSVFVVAYISVLAGRFLTVIARLPPGSRYMSFSTIVGGYSLASILHLSLVSMFQVGTAEGLLLDWLCLILLSVLAMPSKMAYWTMVTRHGKMGHLLADIGLLILTSVLVTLWTREALGAVWEAQKTGIFRAWNDFLLHAAEIQYVQDAAVFAGQSPYLADTAQPFYHRASYAMAAVFNATTQDGALESATYFWLPAGMVLLGAGVCALGTAVGGRLVALLALLALFLLPDAAMYGLKNGYFAFHWLIQVAPGSGYALALALFALALYVEGVRTERFALVILAVALTIASALFRVQVALPAIGLLGVLALWAWLSSHSRHRWATLFVLAACVVIVLLGSEHIELAPPLISGKRDVLRYIEAVHLATPTAYEGWWQSTLAGTSSVKKALVGYPVLVLAELGALIVVLPLVTLIRKHQGLFDGRIDGIPYVLLVVHSLIVFLLPTASNGDITEWSHRSFVLLYAVFAVLEVVWLIGLLQGTAFCRRYAGWLYLATLVMVVMGLLTPWKYGKNAQYGLLRDGPTACRTAISSDFFAASRYIRRHANPADRLQSSDSDPLALAVALTGRPAYVSRLPLFKKIGGETGKLASARFAENASLANIHTYEELRAFGQKAGVRWYLLHESDMLIWSASLRNRAVVTSGTIRVFDLQSEIQSSLEK